MIDVSCALAVAGESFGDLEKDFGGEGFEVTRRKSIHDEDLAVSIA